MGPVSGYFKETVRGGRCEQGETLKQIHGMGTRRYLLSVDSDNEVRSHCVVTGYELDTSGLHPMFHHKNRGNFYGKSRKYHDFSSTYLSYTGFRGGLLTHL
jgi:hypothetical protein